MNRIQNNLTQQEQLGSILKEIKALLPTQNPIDVLKKMVQMAKENPFLVNELKELLDDEG
jgi:hypothetical protein